MRLGLRNSDVRAAIVCLTIALILVGLDYWGFEKHGYHHSLLLLVLTGVMIGTGVWFIDSYRGNLRWLEGRPDKEELIEQGKRS